MQRDGLEPAFRDLRHFRERWLGMLSAVKVAVRFIVGSGIQGHLSRILLCE
jgi:hypothetical protein